MAKRLIVRETRIQRSPRTAQLEGLFDIPPGEGSKNVWRVELPLGTRDWNVGLIVGPSGAGKTTIAREIFGSAVVGEYDWPADRGIVDAFPDSLGIKEIAGLLSSVGFSSPPSWLRPFGALSNGERFRATLARALAEARPGAPVAVDEFTSVVDRTVARIGSCAVAKAVRARGLRFVAVGCHYDVIEWLDPDWIYEPAVDRFEWRRLRRRPPIRLEVWRVDPSAWRAFRRHHYLAAELNRSAWCFVGFATLGDGNAAIEATPAGGTGNGPGVPAVFTAALAFPHPSKPGYREHRTVCLPDFQGAGIGNAMSEFIAGVFKATGKPYRSVTSSPAMIRHRARSAKWRMFRTPSLGNRQRLAGFNATAAVDRLTASFEYVGPPLETEAKKLIGDLLARAGPRSAARRRR